MVSSQLVRLDHKLAQKVPEITSDVIVFRCLSSLQEQCKFLEVSSFS